MHTLLVEDTPHGGQRSNFFIAFSSLSSAQYGMPLSSMIATSNDAHTGCGLSTAVLKSKERFPVTGLIPMLNAISTIPYFPSSCKVPLSLVTPMQIALVCAFGCRIKRCVTCAYQSCFAGLDRVLEYHMASRNGMFCQH